MQQKPKTAYTSKKINNYLSLYMIVPPCIVDLDIVYGAKE